MLNPAQQHKGITAHVPRAHPNALYSRLTEPPQWPFVELHLVPRTSSSSVLICNKALMLYKDRGQSKDLDGFQGVKQEVRQQLVWLVSVVNGRTDEALIGNYAIKHLRYHLICR